MCDSNTVGDIAVIGEQNATTVPAESVVKTGDEVYVRIGTVGFIVPARSGEARLFVLGKSDEMLVCEGFKYNLLDIEATIQVSAANMGPRGCVVFKHNDSIVVAAEAVDRDVLPNMFSVMINSVLDVHQLIIDRVLFLQPGTLPLGAQNEKQRSRIYQLFLEGRLSVQAEFEVMKRA